MKILLRTNSTNPEYYADCDCAVLDVTPELLAHIAARAEISRQAAEADTDLWELYFWSCGPDFYKCTLIEVCAEAVAEMEGIDASNWEEQFQHAGVFPLPDGVDLDRFEPQWTECDQEIIRVQRVNGRLECEVGWVVIPKHSDIYITTEAVALERLESFAKGEMSASEVTAC